MIALSRELVQGGEIGEVTSFGGIHAKDFMASRKVIFGWRCEVDPARAARRSWEMGLAF